jgi:hypothetical protein
VNIIEKLEDFIRTRLNGIDRDEVEYEDGWWETSTGAEFGAGVLTDLLAIIEEYKDTAQEPVAWMAKQGTFLMIADTKDKLPKGCEENATPLFTHPQLSDEPTRKMLITFYTQYEKNLDDSRTPESFINAARIGYKAMLVETMKADNVPE